MSARAIGILAGGGRLPAMIADSVIAHGGSVHIVGVSGEADSSIERFPHTWVNWAQIGKMLSVLRDQGGGQVVIAGGVTRPDLTKLRPDLGFFRVLPQLLAMLAGGDDSVLSRVVKVFEQHGVTVRGAHEVAPDLLAGSGTLGQVALSEEGRRDAAIGSAVRRALAALDAGQAVAVAGGQVLAIEGAEGTDAMLRRTAALAGRGAAMRSGVLTKGPKPGQEMRVDMPAIGPRTIEGAVAAGLAGVAVETGAVLLLDRDEAIKAADDAGCALVGLVAEPAPGTQVEEQLPREAQCVGRLQPSRRDCIDIGKGVQATLRLAPLGTGASVVISRAYVLGIEAQEGVGALLQRVGRLRQWGIGTRRRVGVLVRRAEPMESEADAQTVLRDAAAQGLAGVAIVGARADTAAYQPCAPVADALGIFLVVSEHSARGTAHDN